MDQIKNQLVISIKNEGSMSTAAFRQALSLFWTSLRRVGIDGGYMVEHIERMSNSSDLTRKCLVALAESEYGINVVFGNINSLGIYSAATIVNRIASIKEKDLSGLLLKIGFASNEEVRGGDRSGDVWQVEGGVSGVDWIALDTVNGSVRSVY